jgi:hypothetical protein
MKKMTKMLLVIPVLTGIAFSALADRGIGRKSKSKVELNISTSGGLRNAISLNLKSGLKYTGSLLTKQQYSGSNIINSNLVTYQKGNTIYIIPSKQIIAVPDMKQGYAGMKLIINPHH